MKGYKVFNSDWTCIGFKFEVGKTYEHKGEIALCNSLTPLQQEQEGAE